MEPPVRGRRRGANQPEQRVRQVDPDRVLHALDIRVAMGPLVDVQAAKQAEEGDPEYEDDETPHRHDGESEHEGDEVENGRDGGETSNDDRVDLSGAPVVSKCMAVLRFGGWVRGEFRSPHTHFPSATFPPFWAWSRSVPYSPMTVTARTNWKQCNMAKST